MEDEEDRKGMKYNVWRVYFFFCVPSNEEVRFLSMSQDVDHIF
jgi:hypothetical protein